MSREKPEKELVEGRHRREAEVNVESNLSRCEMSDRELLLV
jgi:hypothetical protein